MRGGSASSGPKAEGETISLAEVLSQLLPRGGLRFGKLSGVLSVNTQARRLGVLLFVLERIQSGKRLARVLSSVDADELKALKDNCVANGALSGYPTASRSSVEHYLELARDLHLVASQGSFYSLTLSGRLAVALAAPVGLEPYPLAKVIRRFFLQHLLAHDFFGMASVFRPIVDGVRTIAEMRARHRDDLDTRLTRIVEASPDPRRRRQARDRLLAIASWKKPHTYAEHMVVPRLHWLADLGLLQLKGASRSVEVAIARPQIAWFRRAEEISFPSWKDVCGLLDEYERSLGGRPRPAEQASPDLGDPCAALERLFRQVSRSRGLQKIRADVASAFFLSSGTEALEYLRSRNETLLDGKGERLCGAWKYSCHMAARATQAFVLRVRNQDLGEEENEGQ